MIENINPSDIENKSFEIISGLLGDRVFSPEEEPIIKRVIHTTADLDYADNLVFSENAVKDGLDALKSGATIITDTQMARAGINKTALSKLDCSALCFMSDPDVASLAKERGVTRAYISMEKAAGIPGPCIFAIGNAPTALISLHELMEAGEIDPSLIIGVPVGFVNVTESKEIIMKDKAPFIVAKGRKGGSNVAAAIVNALLYMITR